MWERRKILGCVRAFIAISRLYSLALGLFTSDFIAVSCIFANKHEIVWCMHFTRWKLTQLIFFRQRCKYCSRKSSTSETSNRPSKIAILVLFTLAFNLARHHVPTVFRRWLGIRPRKGVTLKGARHSEGNFKFHFILSGAHFFLFSLSTQRSSTPLSFHAGDVSQQGRSFFEWAIWTEELIRLKISS